MKVELPRLKANAFLDSYSCQWRTDYPQQLQHLIPAQEFTVTVARFNALAPAERIYMMMYQGSIGLLGGLILLFIVIIATVSDRNDTTSENDDVVLITIIFVMGGLMLVALFLYLASKNGFATIRSKSATILEQENYSYQARRLPIFIYMIYEGHTNCQPLFASRICFESDPIALTYRRKGSIIDDPRIEVQTGIASTIIEDDEEEAAEQQQEDDSKIDNENDEQQQYSNNDEPHSPSYHNLNSDNLQRITPKRVDRRFQLQREDSIRSLGSSDSLHSEWNAVLEDGLRYQDELISLAIEMSHQEEDEEFRYQADEETEEEVEIKVIR